MEKRKIFFWNERDEFGVFSNFHPGPYLIDGESWQTTEHYFAAQKTMDATLRTAIQGAGTPLDAKRMGRVVPLRADWESVKYDVMLVALRAKFAQDPYHRILMNTGDALIYEDSPFDRVWGTGVRGGVGKGQNLLGKALMQIREEFRLQELQSNEAKNVSGADPASTEQRGT